MDQANFICVKLKFRNKLKVTKLDSRVDTSLHSMANLRKLIFKNFPEIEDTVEASSRTTGVAEMVLDVKCQDSAGDCITLESEEDLEVALESRSEESELKFDIDMIQTSPSVVATPALNMARRSLGIDRPVYVDASPSLGRMDTSRAASNYGAGVKQSRPGQQVCRYFARGYCRHGPTCRFSHESSSRTSSETFTQAQRSFGRGLSIQEPNETANSLPFECSNYKEVDAGPSLGRMDTSRAASDFGAGAKQSRPGRQACRYFARGYCKDGPTCRFSHESSSRTSSETVTQAQGSFGRGLFIEEPNETTNSLSFQFSNYKEVDYWLMNQLTLVAGESIEQLSGEKGLRVLSQVVEQRNLPASTIILFVKLLAKNEIRTSMLRQKTNKIYGILLGSPFLLQLHAHVASHLGTRTPEPQDVRPYLLLIEELQSRTADGWKEVPLDAMQSVVSRLEESSPAKDELMATVNRLVDHRDKLQRSLAIAQPDKSLQGAQFRQMSIVASKEELLRFQARQDLPVNRIGIQYSRVSDYLETHFQLLREDCIDPLRQGIKAYQSNCSTTGTGGKTSNSTQELRIYLGVHLVAVRCGDNGVEYVLKFHLPAGGNAAEQWEWSKRLMSGALLCISPDQFQTFFWGVVARRDVKDLIKGLVAIRIIGESGGNVTAGLQSGQTSAQVYVMVESTAAYFEAYHHVLKTLQREEMEDIPFIPYLLHLEPKVLPPAYLRRKGGDEYDFSSVFPDIQLKLGRSFIRVMQSEWPSGWATSLDKAQQEALKQGLTKELAIIQGPPGTGKTFLGLLLVRILLANLKKSPGHESNLAGRRRIIEQVNDDEEYNMTGPILVICYTNHALDQFLEGIYENGEENLIRIGGRSKSEILKERNLQSLIQEQRVAHKVGRGHHRLCGQLRGEKDRLEAEIHGCIDAMGVDLVSYTLLAELGVATWEQIESLFYTLGDELASTKIVELWLNEASCVDPFVAHHFNSNLEFEENDESVNVAEDAKQSSKGRMKLLPTAEADQNGKWIRVTRKGGGRHRQAAPVELDVPVHAAPVQKFDFAGEDNGGDDQRPEEADEDVHPLPQPTEDVEIGRHRNFNEHNDIVGGDPMYDEIPLEDFVDTPNVWQLTLVQRRRLHQYWLEEIRSNCCLQLRKLTEEYQKACKNVKEVENEIELSLLRQSKVIGMTTTAAAKHHDVLNSLKSEIVIVEEAAEVLEGHILACLSPSVKHLILIGDHLQLRPSVAVYRLCTEYKLDVSMFERLVRSDIEHVTLQEQRRMRPNISKLVSSLYPSLRDHESVTQYEDVSGVMQNVFFFDHKAEERNCHDAASKVNPTEAKLVVELCLYLLNQGCYKPENIAILSMYTGQLQEIKALLKQKSKSRLSVRPIGQVTFDDPEVEERDLLPRVSSVDDYQGEESDIIILSLVRSNTTVTKDGVGKIGFLKIENRICVALTRARKGLFIFGNANLLAEKSTLWKQVTNSLRDDGALGTELELYCQNHQDTITKISKAEDFKQVEDGGCSLACEYQLECGHVCPRRCHPGSHDLVVCPKPCLRQYDKCVHFCNLRCHGAADCPPCRVIVTKQLNCMHRQAMDCSQEITDDIQCRSACPTSLKCGHRCEKFCGEPCTASCKERVVKMLPCDHSAKMACHQAPESFSCDEPCETLLPECHHPCGGNCGKCTKGTAHIPCQHKCGRTLACGHLCEAGCSVNCPPCQKKCQKRCFHSQCSKHCGTLCTPCRERCTWRCEHHQCDKFCHEICNRPRCDLPCPKLIRDCGHPCIGLCGEPCPTKCRVCHPQTLDVITLMTLGEYEESDRFVQLQDCGHLFQVDGLDTWMDGNETQSNGSMAIKLKVCPECKTVIWRTHRYSNIVKTTQSQLEEVKKKIYGHNLTRQGNSLLKEGTYVDAFSCFRRALQENPGMMEAHFGIGCAFLAINKFKEAVEHWSFIAERSSFAEHTGCASVIAKARGQGYITKSIENFYGESTSRASNSIATQAMLQWASVLTERMEFTDAVQLCDAILHRDPENQVAARHLKEAAESKQVIRTVVKAMEADVGARGHWYTCPNGHYYTIGECGGAMQVSRCPDCNATVGGGQHRLVEGNKHSDIDGSLRPAWPGN